MSRYDAMFITMAMIVVAICAFCSFVQLASIADSLRVLAGQ